jgi:hypothetical protein
MQVAPRQAAYSQVVKLVALLLLAVGMVAPSQAAQPARGTTGIRITIAEPRFAAEAVSFKAIDQTGYTNWGADEVHAVLIDFNPLRERGTAEYGDVDAGETKAFKAADRCIAPFSACDTGSKNLSFGVALWEKDPAWNPFVPTCVIATNARVNYDNGICREDDLIGRVRLDFTQAQLLAMLPNVGDVVERVVKPVGGDGDYRLTYRIRRLANIEQTIVLEPPQLSRFTLRASVNPPPPPGRVTLTWSGAMGASVDILRGAALIVTTPNDGSHEDRVGGGTYQYRVCNAGTTVCSNTATVTVP